MRSPRLDRWVTASWALSSLDEVMPVQAQLLGRLDCRLVGESASLANLGLSSNALAESIRGLAFLDHLGMSYLWVLGGYELVRTMYERYAENRDLVTPELLEETRRVKEAFVRVRIPLAKWQAAHAHRDTDFAFAWPAYDTQRGVAWKVAPDVFVSRGELADRLLGLLEVLRGV